VTDGDAARVKGHDNAYRRGLVLGLTMAEIMLLILFILLLVLGAIVANRDAAIRARDRRIAQLAPLEVLLRNDLRAERSGVAVYDVIQRIERERQRNDALEREVARLKPYEATGKEIEDIVHAIQRSGGKATPQEIAQRLAQAGGLAKDNETLRGQVAQLTHQIKASGRGGNEFPSCWVTAAGKPQSIFEVVLTGSGVRITDRHLTERVEDEAKLPLNTVTFDAELSPGTFLDQLRPLYSWSVAHSCRFYIIMYSTVASTPVDAVNAANDYFYPDSRIQFRPGRI
jgi:hypothetical protein